MSNNDKFISLESLKEYNKQMKEEYIKPLGAADERLAKELEGKVIVATFKFTPADTNTTITLKNLEGMTEIDWGDGSINNELSHTYQTVEGEGLEEYICKIYDVTSVGSYAFHDCIGLTSIEIPDSVTSILSGAFASCESLTEIIIPNNVTSIPNGVFYECFSLTNVEIPDGVTSIGNSTFYFCESLKNIVLPDSITSIDINAFSECSGLTSIVFKNDIPVEFKRDIFENCSSLTHIYVPYGTSEAYRTKWEGAYGVTQDLLNKIVESDREAYMSDIGALKTELEGQLVGKAEQEWVNEKVNPIESIIQNMGDWVYLPISSEAVSTEPDATISLSNFKAYYNPVLRLVNFNARATISKDTNWTVVPYFTIADSVFEPLGEIKSLTGTQDIKAPIDVVHYTGSADNATFTYEPEGGFVEFKRKEDGKATVRIAKYESVTHHRQAGKDTFRINATIPY